MQILCTNDDGILGEGLHTLESVASEFGTVTTVVPDRERSATSQALTLHEPIRVKKVGDRRFTVNGTPADCMWVALNHILDEDPDLVLSGINRGPNLAMDVLYSGTVAGAIEGLLRDIPSIALSFVGAPDYPFEKIRSAASQVLKHVLSQEFPSGSVLNINFPHPENPGIHGIRMTHLGKRYYSQEVEERRDPRGSSYFWIGGSTVTNETIPGSDCTAVADGFISITPLHLQLTNQRAMEALSGWNNLKLSLDPTSGGGS